MLKIQFQVIPTGEDVHEFDLGHFIIEADNEIVSSENRTPDQSMMIFIAASDLLGGVVNLLDKNQKWFEFNGCDSSFILNFIRNRKGEIEITHKKKIISTVDNKELINAAYNASNDLMQEYGQNLAGSGAAKEGLEYTLQDARSRVGHLLVQPEAG